MPSDILVTNRIVRLSLHTHLVWSCALKNSWGNDYETNTGSYWSWEKNNMLREMEKSCCDRDARCLYMWSRYMMPPCVTGMHDASTVTPKTEAGRQAQTRQGGGRFPNRTENLGQEAQTMRSCRWRRGEERSRQRKPQKNPLGCANCEVK